MSTCIKERPWVIYSPNESASMGGAGFWSAEQAGWVERDYATEFTEAEKSTTELPQAVGLDARWVLRADVDQHN